MQIQRTLDVRTIEDLKEYASALKSTGDALIEESKVVSPSRYAKYAAGSAYINAYEGLKQIIDNPEMR